MDNRKRFCSIDNGESSTSSDDCLPNPELQELERIDKTKLHKTTSEVNEITRTLANTFKEYCTLSDMRSITWTEEVYNLLEKFIQNDKTDLFCLFCKTKKLEPSLTISKTIFDEMMYFVKSGSLKENNISLTSKMIQFGSIKQNFKITLILVLKLIYVPLLCAVDNFPPNSKICLVKSVLKFSRYLEEMYYLQFGLSHIFVPIIQSPNEQAYVFVHTNKYLLCQFESVVVSWCQQIETALTDVKNNYQLINVTTLLDELHFWTHRCDNLQFLLLQLKDKYAIMIYKILKSRTSIYISQLNTLKLKLKEALSDAVMNITCLRILKEPCELLQKVSCPTQIIPFLPDIFFKIEVICSQSIFYNNWEKAELLHCGLNNQIMDICNRFVNLKEIFLGKTEPYVAVLKLSVVIGKHYKILFKMVTDLHNEKSDTKWNTYSSHILNNTDMFISRCQDLIQICNCINVFYCSKETETLQLSLNQHIHFQKEMSEIFENFSLELSVLKNEQENLLILHNRDWYNIHLRFKTGLETITDYLENIVEKLFRYVTTLDEGLNILRIMYYYSKLPQFSQIFYKYVDLVYNIFGQEINEVRDMMIIINNTHQKTSFDTINSLRLFIKKRRLQSQNEVLQTCSWISECAKLQNVNYNYEELTNSIDISIIDAYSVWQSNTSILLKNKLQRPLITKCIYTYDLYEVNLDRALLKTYREAKIWLQIGFILPLKIEQVVKQMDKIMILYRNTELLVMNYNRIVAGLSSEEHHLFSETTQFCKNLMKPCLCKLYWDNDYSNEYVVQYQEAIKKVENTIKVYKERNGLIVNICQEICSLQLIPDIIIDDSLQKLECKIEVERLSAVKQILNYYNLVCYHLYAIYKELAVYIKKLKDPWACYINKMDSLFETALSTCVKNYMKKLHRLFSQTKTENNHGSILSMKICMSMVDSQIKLTPSLSEFATFAGNILPRIILELNTIPRIFNHFKKHSQCKKKLSYAKNIAANNEIVHLQAQINAEFYMGLRNVRLYIKERWLPYRNIWKTDTITFEAEYRTMNPNLESVNNDIEKYIGITKKMSAEQHQTAISIFNFDEENLALQLKTCCEARLLFLSHLPLQNITIS